MWIISTCVSITQNTVFTKAGITHQEFEELYGGVQISWLSAKENRFHGISLLGDIYISSPTYKT